MIDSGSSSFAMYPLESADPEAIAQELDTIFESLRASVEQPPDAAVGKRP